MKENAVYINDIFSFLPNSPVDNDRIESILGMIGGKPSRARKMILRNNGIKTRYYAIDPETGEENFTNAEMTAEAIRGLSFNLRELESLVCGTSTPDQIMPNHALMVQGEIGSISSCEAIATIGVCLSGVTALKYAYLNILSGDCNNAVATGSDRPSCIIKGNDFEPEAESKIKELGKQPEIAFEKDFLRWMLSDGAGAVLLQPHPNQNNNRISLKIEWIEIRSYANIMETCMYAGAEKIDGHIKGWSAYDAKTRNEQSVMAVKQDVKLLNENVAYYTGELPMTDILKKRHMAVNEIDFFLPHYSSHYFRSKTKESLKKAGLDIPYEKWFTNLYSKGNTGAASIYIMLDELYHSGKLESGQKILCGVPESARFSSGLMLFSVV
uniref:3-oxoacyl-[acyl-carrier-protein] synthase-3 n=1 Tax=Candidatus Kentrum sp. DK TaxID=2126562 RepID=A0A450SN04_9GAMM|nr:MAG: 3-oxoacyl-[acyl-carrier-protein] synthase-3 [Candidatus Kentron sp. DK]